MKGIISIVGVVMFLLILKLALVIGFFVALIWGILWVLRSQGVL